MKNTKTIQDKINSLQYGDSRVIKLECNYFADEVKIIFEGSNGNSVINCIGCYEALFDHVKNYDKLMPVKEMKIPQTPYFLQEIIVSHITFEEKKFHKCNINMFPLSVEIICEDIQICERSYH